MLSSCPSSACNKTGPKGTTSLIPIGQNQEIYSGKECGSVPNAPLAGVLRIQSRKKEKRCRAQPCQGCGGPPNNLFPPFLLDEPLRRGSARGDKKMISTDMFIGSMIVENQFKRMLFQSPLGRCYLALLPPHGHI